MCESTKPTTTVDVGTKIIVTNAMSCQDSYSNGDTMVVKSVYGDGSVTASMAQTSCGLSDEQHYILRSEFEVIE